MNFKYPATIALLTFIVLIWVSSNISWGGNKWKGILESDAKGYYAYLPAVFIYQDLNFNFFDKIEKKKYYQEHLYYDYRVGSKEKRINKYYCGTAIAQMPFFFVAHAITYILEKERDGYSKPYIVLVNISAIFYHILGIIFIWKLLVRYKVSYGHAFLVMLVTSFGTNLFAYTVVEPGMSHVYSFAFISMFIYYSKVFFENQSRRHIVIMAFLLGIIILCRPINGMIVLLLPFISGSWQNLKKGLMYITNKWKIAVTASILLLSLCSIQLVIYKISTGGFFVYSYGQEQFNFLNPHMIDILFSYKKGLFLYTPIYLVSLSGLFFIRKYSKFQFISCSLFLILITYIFSSWWMWYYGGSFSSRVYVDYIPVFMILLGLFLKDLYKKRLKKVLITLLFLLIALCQVQTYQYRRYDIHYSEMNEEKYWKVFLMIDKL